MHAHPHFAVPPNHNFLTYIPGLGTLPTNSPFGFRAALTWPTIDPMANISLDIDFDPINFTGSGYLISYYLPIYTQWPQLDLQNRAFIGFNTQADGLGTFMDSSTIITQPTTLFAIWQNGVSFHAGNAPAYVILSGNEFRNLPATGQPLGAAMPPEPIWPGMTFHSWSTRRDGAPGGMIYDETVPVNAGRTLFAVWQATINFDPAGGTMPGQSYITIFSGNPIGQALLAPAPRTGYNFAGWNTAPDGSGMTFTTETANPVMVGMTLYAQWTPTSAPPPDPTLTIVNNPATVNPSGQSPGASSLVAAGVIVNLVAGTSAAYQFIGWVSSQVTFVDGSSLNTSFTMPNENVTVTANWQPLHPITVVDSGLPAGITSSASANLATAIAGTQITLTAGAAPAGYQFGG
ncbi:MAG: InlB B-repeat-containing protein [Defluviitaleaceae bacterium]|nr:InlB B-repeat-containing protein [Defluviitaleaceae bacterium]